MGKSRPCLTRPPLPSRRPERNNRWLACLHEAEARIASSHGQHEAADRGRPEPAWSKLGDDTRLRGSARTTSWDQ